MIRLMLFVFLLGQSTLAYAQGVLVKSGQHTDFVRLVVPLQGIGSIQATAKNDRSIELKFKNAVPTDTTQIFDFIGRDKIRKVTPSRTGLIIDLACDCAFSAHQKEGSFFYIDILEPPQIDVAAAQKVSFEDFQKVYGIWEYRQTSGHDFAVFVQKKPAEDQPLITTQDEQTCDAPSISQLVFEKGRKYGYEDLLLSRGRLTHDSSEGSAETLEILSGYIALGMSDEALALSRFEDLGIQEEVAALTDIVASGTSNSDGLQTRIQCDDSYVFWAEFSEILPAEERDPEAMQRNLEALPKVLQEILEGHKKNRNGDFFERPGGSNDAFQMPNHPGNIEEVPADENNVPIDVAPVEFVDSNIIEFRNTSEFEEAKIAKISSLLIQEEYFEALTLANSLDVEPARKIAKIDEVLLYVGTQLPEEDFLALVASEFWTAMDDELVTELNFEPIARRFKQLNLGEFNAILKPILPKDFHQAESTLVRGSGFIGESHNVVPTAPMKKENAAPIDVRFAGLENLLNSSENLLKETENLDALNSLEAIGF